MKTILIILTLLFVLFIFESASTPHTGTNKPQNPSVSTDSNVTQVYNKATVKEQIQAGPAQKKRQSSTEMGIFSKLLSVVQTAWLPALIAAIISITYNWWISAYRRGKERRSLILAFAYELVLAFHRCVIYYLQQLQRVVSFSELFAFTNASTLAAFAAVGSEPQLVATIVHLKARYFQVTRHVEQAAKFAVESELHAKGTKKQGHLGRLAARNRDIALAFFLAEYRPELYKDIEEKTTVLLNEAEKTSQRNVTGYLSNVFSTAKDVKQQLDKLKKQEMAWYELKGKLDELEKKLNACLIPQEEATKSTEKRESRGMRV